MKRLLICAALLATFLLAQNTLAATYGPDGAKFTLTPAAGWKETAIDGGVELTNGKSMLIIAIGDPENFTQDQFADGLAKEAGLKDYKKTVEGGVTTVSGKVQGVDVTISISMVNGKALVISKIGPDVDAMQKILQSVQDVQDGKNIVTYGPDWAKFTITPAAGWKATAIDGGVQLTKGKSMLIIELEDAKGATPEEFADEFIKKAGLSDSEKDVTEDGVTVSGTTNGTKVEVVIVKEDDKFLSISKIGEDSEDIDEMVDSLQEID